MAHTEEDILAGLAEIVNEETGVETADVQLDKSFTDDLDIDSISMMTIVVNAEEKFDVRIPDEEVKNLVTVGDAVKFIQHAQARLLPMRARPLAASAHFNLFALSITPARRTHEREPSRSCYRPRHVQPAWSRH